MTRQKLARIHRDIAACRACPRMMGTPVHGVPVESRVFLLGQAPGPREASYGRPFAYTAGRTLFRWFEDAGRVDETAFRENVYMAAVARCFPGKGSGGGDRVPDRLEIVECSKHLRAELDVLTPSLILAVGKIAITQVLGKAGYGKGALLKDVVGKMLRVEFHGHPADVICLPHPSGLSSWHKTEPGRTLLAKALRLVVAHPEWRSTFA